MPSPLLTLFNARGAREFYAAGHWRADTIYALIAANAARAPEKTAVRDRFGGVTYAEFTAATDRLAADLRAHGLKPGDRVAVWLPSRVETAVVLAACSREGFVCCPSLHRDHTAGEIEELLRRMSAAALITETGYGADAHRHSILGRAPSIQTLRRVVAMPPLGPEGRLAPMFAGAGEVEPGAPDSDPDSIVYLAYTSGTTGAPKGVMHSDNTLLANARAMARDWALYDDSVVYSFSPLSHNLGLGAAIMTLTGGGEFVLHDPPRGAGMADRIVEVGATFVIGVPTHAIDLLSELRARKLTKLGAVKGFRVSGASVPPVVAAGLLEHGVTPQSGFGMTEAGSHHYTHPGDPPALIVETSGRACDGFEVRIFSSEDPETEVPAGTIGQICSRGASLMLGYFDDQRATESSFNKAGWFMTGDLGWADEQGYLRVTGRKKDVIIRGGHNIYPARIEALAMRHADVAAAAAIPARDERLGERVCLALALKKDRALDANAFLRHLDEAGLSKFDMPEFLLVVDAMPLTPSGKILKRALLDAVDKGELSPAPVRFTTT